jgi:hypothetical protein
MFGIIFCIISIPFIELLGSLNFNPLIFFSLAYALFFSIPFLLTNFDNLVKAYKRKNYGFEDLNQKANKKSRKFYITLVVSVLIMFSVFTIQSVTSEISYVSESGLKNLSILPITIYLSIVTVFFISIFVLIFYFGE